MYRTHNPFQDNHRAYFDTGSLEVATLPDHTPGIPKEEHRDAKALDTIYALNRSLKDQTTESQEHHSPARAALRKLSPITHFENTDGGDPIKTEENSNGFDPLIEAFNKSGLTGMKARLIAEMAPLLSDNNVDKTDLRNIIAFKIGESETDTKAPIRPGSVEEATKAVAEFLEHAQQAFGENQISPRGGPVTSEKRSIFRNPFRRPKKTAPSVSHAFTAKLDEYQHAYRHGGDPELKATFLLHMVPQLADAKIPEATGKIAKVIDYSPKNY